MDVVDVDAIRQIQPVREYIQRVAMPSNKKRLWCPLCQQRGDDGVNNAPALEIYNHDKWFCHGCRRGGDIIEFAMLFHNLDFRSACDLLTGGQSTKIDPVEFARREREHAERLRNDLEQKIAEAQKAIEELRKAETWLRYYEQSGEKGRGLWEKRGVPPPWQSYWELGYCDWNEWWSTPTLTIPIRSYDWSVINVKHRLLNRDKDKYRYEKKGIGAPLFISIGEQTTGPLFLTEGEIKAAVTCVTIDDSNCQVAGIPSTTANEQTFSILKDHEPIYFCPDPDAFDKSSQPVQKVIDILGKERVRIVELPDKIDDLIVAGLLDKNGLREYVRRARRA